MPTRRSTLSLILASVTLPAMPAFGAEPEVFTDGGLAIRGIDPVAYFTEGGPVMGTADHQSTWNGATWAFASAENKALFDGDPDAYAPRYGGYCAYAVSKGGLATTDPEAWTIHDGALYLNFSTTVRSIWSEDKDGNISRADANWPGVLN